MNKLLTKKLKKIKKIFEKTIDKSNILCYNYYRKKERGKRKMRKTYFNKNTTRYATYGGVVPKYDAIVKACEEALKEKAEREAKRNKK